MALLTDTITNGWPQIVQEHPKELQAYWNFREEMAVVDGLILKATTIVIPPTMQESTLLSQHSSVDRASVLSHAVRQWHDRSHQCLFASMWIGMAQLPCWPPRGQQVSHQ